jgi:inner membrane protein
MSAIVFAGTFADFDWLSHNFGPFFYFTAHHTYTHSLAGALAITAAIFLLFLPSLRKTDEHDGAATQAVWRKEWFPAVFAAMFSAALLHLAMDACQSEGVALFWPFSARRFAADWLAGIDPWILAMLIAGIALPELFRLVGSEIGAKEKGPRGKTGAMAALALVLLYIGARAAMHSNAVALLESHSYRGEAPRQVAALPEAVSPFDWRGIVETESSLHELKVHTGGGGYFNPEAGVTIFKPEASAILDAARAARSVQTFLRVARFPKATVEKTETGSEVVLRDLRYAATGETRNEIAVLVRLDAAGKVVSEEMAWARELRRR